MTEVAVKGTPKSVCSLHNSPHTDPWRVDKLRAVALLRLGNVFYLCLLEARPVVQGIFLLRFITGASLSGSAADPLVWTAAAIWVCVTWAVYLLNGITDVEEDRINRLNRPVARGELRLPEAIAVVGVLAAFGLAASAALGLPVWAAATLLALGWAYSAPPLRLKRWPAGLAAVGILAGLLTYYAGHESSGSAGTEYVLWTFAGAMALWMGLVGQTKDLPDVEGDRRSGRRSLPVMLGVRLARRIISAMAVGIGGGFLLAATCFVPELFASAVVVCIGAVAVAGAALGIWTSGQNERVPYHSFMVTQYGAHLAVIVL